MYVQWKVRQNDWCWVGKQSEVGWDEELFLWTASDETWEIIFEVNKHDLTFTTNAYILEQL